MVQLPIKRSIDRIPGGMMIVPLFLGALFKTFLPGTPQFFGSFTGALFNAPLTILAVFYVCMGATIEFNATPYILKKGGALFAAKVGTAVVPGIVLGRIWHEMPVASGVLAGLSTLAVVAAFNDTNGGLYMALMGAGAGGSILPLMVGMILGNLDREIPAIVAAANPAYKPAAAAGTILVATSVVVTAILVPVVTAWWHRRVSQARPAAS